MQRTQKPARSKFWRVYFIVMAAVIALIFLGLVYLWTVMDAYEKSTPEYALQTVENYFSVDQYEHLAQNAGLVSNPYESDEVRKAVLQEQFSGGELESTRLAGGSGDNMQSYQVSIGDNIIGSFELRHDDEGMFGHWQVSDAKINPAFWGDISLRLPSTAQLFVNEVPVLAQAAVQSNLPYDTLDKLPETIVQPMQTEYLITDLTTQPNLRVVDEFGNELTVNIQEEAPWPLENTQMDTQTDSLATQHYADLVLPAPAGDVAALQAMALEDAETYSRYLSNDDTFGTLSPRLLADSSIFSEMRAMETMFYTPHTSVSFTQAEAGNIQQYSPDIFSIDVDYLYTVFRGEDRPYLFDTKITFIYVRVGDDWRIGDIQIRS